MSSANQRDVMEFAMKCKRHEGLMKSPIVWSIKKGKALRYTKWQIFLGLRDADNKEIPVTVEHIKRAAVPDGVMAVYWSVSGLEGGKQTKSKETFISNGKNFGKNNETTVLTQAILDLRSEFNLKLRKGGATSKSSLITPGSVVTFEQLFESKTRGSCPWRVHQMALQDVQHTTKAGTSNWRHMTFPGFIQPKYDGTRFTVVGSPLLEKSRIKGIDGFSRGLETVEGHDHILTELLPIVQKYPGLYLDGELWKEGYGLQTISGSSRRLDSSRKNNGGDALKLDFYIFDCFYLDKKVPWIERRELLKEISLSSDKECSIKFAPDREYKSRDEAMTFFQEYVDQGYEGGVLRNSDSLYEYGLVREVRSYTSMKIKPVKDEDWPVIGFTNGEIGKDVGALIWILEVNEDLLAELNVKYEMEAKLLPTAAENQFTAVTKGFTYKERYAAFQFLTKNPKYFTTHLKDQLMRVQYSIISEYGKPQQPKILGFRDLKVNKAFIAAVHEFMDSDDYIDLS
jgi:ATP-dependent DNA ligase